MRILLVALLLASWPSPAWAKTIKISKGSINVNQLHDELLAQFPTWKGTPRPQGGYANPLLYVEHTDQEIRLAVPDDADEAAVQAVVAAHVPRSRVNHPPAPTTVEERLKRLEAAMGLDRPDANASARQASGSR